MLDDLTILVMAGGRSNRFKENKLAIEIAGVPCLDRVLNTCKSLTDKVIVLDKSGNRLREIRDALVDNKVYGKVIITEGARPLVNREKYELLYNNIWERSSSLFVTNPRHTILEFTNWVNEASSCHTHIRAACREILVPQGFYAEDMRYALNFHSDEFLDILDPMYTSYNQIMENVLGRHSTTTLEVPADEVWQFLKLTYPYDKYTVEALYNEHY